MDEVTNIRDARTWLTRALKDVDGVEGISIEINDDPALMAIELSGGREIYISIVPPEAELKDPIDVRARDNVISAALHLTSVEWGNGRETAGASMSLDMAQDEFDSALAQYVAAAATAKGVNDNPKIVVLCGSTRFADAFRDANRSLTLAGVIVLTIGCDMHSDAYVFADLSDEELAKVKADLDELHKRKIDAADEVLVLNVGGYIGESTRSEIAYAKQLGRPVRYLEALTEDVISR